MSPSAHTASESIHKLSTLKVSCSEQSVTFLLSAGSFPDFFRCSGCRQRAQPLPPSWEEGKKRDLRCQPWTATSMIWVLLRTFVMSSTISKSSHFQPFLGCQLSNEGIKCPPKNRVQNRWHMRPPPYKQEKTQLGNWTQTQKYWLVVWPFFFLFQGLDVLLPRLLWLCSSVCVHPCSSAAFLQVTP